MGEIYIESYSLAGGLGEHAYLIYRPTANAPIDTWELIRGGPSPGANPRLQYSHAIWKGTVDYFGGTGNVAPTDAEVLDPNFRGRVLLASGSAADAIYCGEPQTVEYLII